MTDKEQIMIDGVGVKKCDFFLLSNKYCGLYSTGCRFVPNCHFKQLARKTQECEELKEKSEEIKEDRYNLNMEMYVFDRYRKALEEIEGLAIKNQMENFYYSDRNNLIEKTVNLTRDYALILDIINKAKGE